jgi:hypothetical protein
LEFDCRSGANARTGGTPMPLGQHREDIVNHTHCYEAGLVNEKKRSGDALR